MKSNKERINFLTAFFLLAVIFYLAGCGIFFGNKSVDLEQEILKILNEHRSSLGLNNLDWSDVIADEARNHSQNMANGTVPFGHSGFEERKKNIKTQISFIWISEVVAWINDFFGLAAPAEKVFNGWLSNPEHRTALEGICDMAGVGVVKTGTVYYFTVILLKKS